MDISCIVFSRSSKIFPNFNIFEFFLSVVDVVISLQTGSLVHFPGKKMFLKEIKSVFRSIKKGVANYKSLNLEKNIGVTCPK